MPFGFVAIGLMMIVSAIKGTHIALGTQIKKDFTGDKNFLYWLIALGIVGSLGYVESLKNFSRLFLTFIIVAMVIKNGGFAAQFMNAIKQGPITPPKSAAASASAAPAGSNTTSDAASILKSGATIVSAVAKVAPLLLA